MKPFRFGCQSYSARSADDWREQPRRAEALGYSTFSTADHYIGPGPALESAGHPVQDVAAIPAMAVAAEVTDRIRIGCRVLCVDYHQPVVLAKELATLAMFSGGRLEIGLGAGWLANEYAAIGLPMDRAGVRIDRLAEVTRLVRAFLAGGALEVRGDHVTAVEFEAVPAAAGATIMIGGGARRVLGVAGELADIVSVNFDNSTGRLGPESFANATAEVTTEKIGWIKAGAGSRFDEIELETRAYSLTVTDSGAEVAEQMAQAFGIEPDQVRAHPHMLIGSVDSICDDLQERRERYGFSYVTVGARDMDAFAPVVERLAGT